MAKIYKVKIRGVVKKHKGRGKELGFPTANLDAPADIADGIYVGLTKIHNAPFTPSYLKRGEGELLLSLVFIGAAETFGETERYVEVYILDFKGDLYGKEIEVELKQKIRDNKKFESKQELIEQMKKDEEVARKYFSQ